METNSGRVYITPLRARFLPLLPPGCELSNTLCTILRSPTNGPNRLKRVPFKDSTKRPPSLLLLEDNFVPSDQQHGILDLDLLYTFLDQMSILAGYNPGELATIEDTTNKLIPEDQISADTLSLSDFDQLRGF